MRAPNLNVTDVERMSAILEVFSLLDDTRWNQEPTDDLSDYCYNLINYCTHDLTEDEKLLTHWLCYITDRRMPFKRVWDVGGYVISHLVRRYTVQRDRSVREVLFRPRIFFTGG